MSLLVRKIASSDVHCLCTVNMSFKKVSTSPRVACHSVTCQFWSGKIFVEARSNVVTELNQSI